MILKMIDRFPGGRLFVLLVPVVLFLLGLAIFGPTAVLQIAGSVVIVLSIANLYSWRENVSIYFRERNDAAAVWLSIGSATVFLTTVFASGYAIYTRAYAVPPSDLIAAIIRFSYAFGFGALYLVPKAHEAEVPPHGWYSLLALVGAGTAIALFGRWWF